MLIYYFILPVLAASLAVALRDDRRGDLLTLAIAALLTILISGMRWHSDIDHAEYAGIFAETPQLSWFTLTTAKTLYGELGYLIASSAAKSIGIEFFFFSLLCTLTAIIPKALVMARLSRGAALAFTLYLCLDFVTIEFIQLRWAVATGLIALAFWHQYRRRLWLSVATILFASFFHSFAAVFLLVILLAEVRSPRVFALATLAMSIIGVLVAKGAEGVIPGLGGPETYVAQRALHYFLSDASHVGALSYLKLALFPCVYFVMRARHPECTKNETVQFLRKVAFGCIALTLMLSFVPTMHFRAAVMADFFGLLLTVRVLDREVPVLERTTVLLGFAGLYAVWFLFDVRNYIVADRLYVYSTWLKLIM